MTPTRQQYLEFYEYLEAHPESCVTNIGTSSAIIAEMEQPRRLTPLQRDCIGSKPLTFGEELTLILILAVCVEILVDLTLVAIHFVPIVWRML